MTAARARHRAHGTARVIALLGAGLTLGLTSCTATPAVAPDPSGALSSSGTADPGPALTSARSGVDAPATLPPAAASATAPANPEHDPSGIAAAVGAALTRLAGGGDAVTSDRVRAAIGQGFADAGATPESVEVSADSTPTGLDVAAIQGAGLIRGTCVFGEVREGTATVVVLPALASGRCFVGDQR
ncbi:DUF6993 domain-containing protein [Arthrobacter sp. TMS1-12-1]